MRRILMGASGSGIILVNTASGGVTGSGTSTSLTVNKPTNTEQGDIMVAFLAADGSGAGTAWTQPSGWTEVLDDATIPHAGVSYKVAGASEGSSYTFDRSGKSSATASFSGIIVTYRYASYDTIGAIQNVSGASSVTAPSVTASTASSLLLAYYASNSSGGSWSTPTGMASVSSVNTYNTIAVFSQEISSGATGTKASTISPLSGNISGVLLVLKPT